MKRKEPYILATVCILLLAACTTPTTSELRPISAALPPLPEGVLDEAQVDIKPEASRRAVPEYPYHLRSRGVSGEVTLAFIVSVDGKVRDILVTYATNEEFAKAAVKALQQWSFVPARKNGAAVACRIPAFKLTFDT